MALSMDEQRVLAEIERRLANDDPVLAARLTSFRLPRMSLAPRSARSRLVASLLMLGVVAVVSVFVYALMPFHARSGGASGGATAGPARSSLSSPSPAQASTSLPGSDTKVSAPGSGQAALRSGSAPANGQ